jgi:hypothetical protein
MGRFSFGIVAIVIASLALGTPQADADRMPLNQ